MAIDPDLIVTAIVGVLALTLALLLASWVKWTKPVLRSIEREDMLTVFVMACLLAAVVLWVVVE